MSENPIEVCERCSAGMEVVQPLNPAKARCPQCGHEIDFLWDPAPPKDPYGEADGLLIIESFNGREKEAAIALRAALGLTPAEALEFLRGKTHEVLWPWGNGLWQLFQLKERLDAMGVSSKIERRNQR